MWLKTLAGLYQQFRVWVRAIRCEPKLWQYMLLASAGWYTTSYCWTGVPTNGTPIATVGQECPRMVHQQLLLDRNARTTYFPVAP
jgi:hypothetical protein